MEEFLKNSHRGLYHEHTLMSRIHACVCVQLRTAPDIWICMAKLDGYWLTSQPYGPRMKAGFRLGVVQRRSRSHTFGAVLWSPTHFLWWGKSQGSKGGKGEGNSMLGCTILKHYAIYLSGAWWCSKNTSERRFFLSRPLGFRFDSGGLLEAEAWWTTTCL